MPVDDSAAVDHVAKLDVMVITNLNLPRKEESFVDGVTNLIKVHYLILFDWDVLKDKLRDHRKTVPRKVYLVDHGVVTGERYGEVKADLAVVINTEKNSTYF